MRGYPKGFLCKRDYENLLVMPEYAKSAKDSLAVVAVIDDSKIDIDTGTAESPKPSSIDNPLPLWKRIGYKSKAELVNASKSIK